MLNKIKEVELIFKRFILVDNIIPYKYKLKSFYENNDEFKNLIGEKKVILMQTPLHKNLGDHAIAYSERKFFEENFSEYKILEIPFKDVMKKSYYLKKVITENDIIAIIGGGNMTDMYIEEEYMRRFIIKTFRNTKIISFPQTISFSDKLTGRFELNKSIRTYSKHKDLTIVAREPKSYEIMRKIYSKNNILLTPDIVLFLDKREIEKNKRNGCLFLLRKDIEKVIDIESEKKIKDSTKKQFSEIYFEDTVISENVPLEKRELKLNTIWNKIKSSEVVITDRLHGMIFCAITATPCIVLKNSNHKIEESYKAWLSDLEYIKLINSNDLENLDNIIIQLKKTNLKEKKLNSCRNKFEELKLIIGN